MDTQTTPAVAETPAAPSLPEGGDDASLDTRASALLEQIQTEQKTAARDAQTANTTEPAKTEPAADPAKAAPVTAAETPAEKTAEQVVEERRQRIAARDEQIAQMANDERAKVAAARVKKQERAPEAAPAPPQNGIAITDAASFFQAAEKLQIPPQDLAAWLTNQQDPAKAAEAAAKRSLSPVEQKLKELSDQLAARDERDRQAAEQAQVNQLVEQNHKIILGRLDEAKSEAPLAAAFAAKSPARYRRAVESICDGLPPGFTAQDVIDQLEEDLSDLQLSGSTASTTPTGSAKPKTPAAVKANVGNRLAAERATTVEDDGDDADEDLESRARKLKARLAAAG